MRPLPNGEASKLLEQLDIELRNEEFREALNLAGRLAIESKDPARRFWEVDAAGWRSKQYNVAIPPAQPDNHNAQRLNRIKPIPGAAFPS